MADNQRPGEFELIARYFAPIAGPGGLGLLDDAGLLRPGRGYEVVVTADALVAGVHFFPDDPPDAIGWKALAVNLSDLAAKGAKPEGFVLTLALPRGWTEGWLQFNTPFNLSLAWLAYAETRIELRRAGDELVVRLRAPLNLDARKVEAGPVVVTLPDGARIPVVVTEDSPSAEYFGGRCAVKAAAGTTIEASYGYGYLGRRASLRW